MAGNGIALDDLRVPLRIAPWIVETAVIGLLLLIFVGLTPFEVRNAATLDLTPGTANGSGDMVRQVAYLAVFTVILAGAIQRRGMNVLRTVPATMILLLLWCLASALWADQGGIAFRRAGLEIVVVTSLMLSVEAIGTERCLTLLRYVLGGILIVNWISIPIIPQARHLPGEVDPSLIGDWRGLYFQKNITGAVCVMSAFVFGYFAYRFRRWSDIALLIGALGFLVMTNSKTSMGLLPLAIVCAGAYMLAARKPIDRMIVLTSLGLLAVVTIAGAILEWDKIAQILSDPSQFTGRVAIWRAEAAFIADHPFLGSGFGTFADTGMASPLHNYVAAEWVRTIAQGHNGYLQLLVTVGTIGFALATLALIAMPGVEFWRADETDPVLTAMLFAVFVFEIFHNLTESDFLEADGPAWAMFVLMIAMLRDRRRHGSA